MGSPVARLPRSSGDGSDGVPPFEVYKTAIDEYRFQAQFNWSRTQYMLVFNTGILAAATAVASRPGRSAALVFGLGAVSCLLSWLVMRTQHAYYRAARSRMVRVEDATGIPQDQRIDTTATLGARSQFINVTQLIYLLLAAVAIADLVGVGIVAAR